MKIKILSLLVMSALVLHLSGCSSSNDDVSDTEVAEAQDPALDTEGADQAQASDEASGDDLSADEDVVADSGDENLPDSSLEQSDGAVDDDLLADDTGSSDTSDVAETALSEEATTSDAVADSSSDMMNSPTDETPIADSSTDASSSEMVSAPTEETPIADNSADTTSEPAPDYSAPKPMVSYKKIKDVPFQQGGQLMNTVYVGRADDTWGGVSTKIYGNADHAKELKKANPSLASREVKVGDKIYYNSPNRPQDGEKLLTYYEDSGVPAQTYTAKAGDNIRTVGKELLGNQNSWKELYATNLGVESKGELAEGTELRYWAKDAQAAAPAPKATEEHVADVPPSPAPTQQDDFALPDDMTQNQAHNNDSTGALGTTAAVEPPPPPPPPPPVQAPAPQKSVASNGMDKDMTFMLSAGGLLLIGVGVLIGIIKKSRARKMSMNTHTQI